MASRTARAWWITGLVLISGAVVLSSVASGRALTVLTIVFASLWAAPTVVWGLWRMWRWLTYRVGMRLAISYLLLGVTPFFFCFAFAGFALYILMGQYTSVRAGSEVERLVERLRPEVVDVAEEAAIRGLDAATARLRALEAEPPEPWPRLEWLIRSGDRIETSSGLTVDGPVGVSLEDVGARLVRVGGRYYGLIAASSGRYDVGLLLPLSRAAGRALAADSWFQAAFVGDGADDGGGSVDVSAGADHSGPGVTVRAEDDFGGDLFSPWDAPSDSIFDQSLILWFRQPAGVRDLVTGDEITNPDVTLLLRTSPRAVWHDLVLTRTDLSEELQGVMLGVAAFFALVYTAAVGIAGSMIVSITRSTARLSRGAEQVAAGNLDHRIKVRRNDQLGDLAASFNTMTASVQSMLEQIREKERLARELELAREIQRSLLPNTAQRHGPLRLFAAFRPAAEVGGDYFDVVPLTDGRLLVAIGDVAGHGLPTGLLMASLKAALGALVEEGYRGRELVGRVGRVLRTQRHHRTMATLMVAEIDVESGRITVANAGHPPAMVLDPDGTVHEVGPGAVPLGSPLSRPSEGSASLVSGARVVLYSDGVVEATDAAGDPFGYDRLEAVIRSCGGVAAEVLVTEILRQVDEHIGAGSPSDDITVLVVERTGGEG